MNYVPSIEPRLTPHRPSTPGTTGQCLVEWLRDLEQESVARLELISVQEATWTPHPDANDVAVTFWHIARWLDVLAATSVATEPTPRPQSWERDGWQDRTGYDPAGIGYLGLGTLTGYTPEEMRAVPRLTTVELATYLRSTVEALESALGDFEPADLLRDQGFGSPFQILGSTLQGSFGHLGEIDCLVALRSRMVSEDSTDPRTP
ncbi:DinB family protein [Nocardioides sp.]|uniref:DinB family protein n=1 Tax=Nocardioides sp. TaxID=35761 RepID=UPI0027369265|nr:DinB family protein [Nocardioides sp.]MDP3890817.1 DinB family protein [Nocardioides sp.]